MTAALHAVPEPQDRSRWMDDAGLELSWDLQAYERQYKLKKFVSCQRSKKAVDEDRRKDYFGGIDDMSALLLDSWSDVPPAERLDSLQNLLAAKLRKDPQFQKHVFRPNAAEQFKKDFQKDVSAAGAVSVLVTYREACRDGHWP